MRSAGLHDPSGASENAQKTGNRTTGCTAIRGLIMPSLTYFDVSKYAKSQGFNLKRSGQGYFLVTCFGQYQRRNLKEVSSQIRKDSNP